MSKGNGNGGQDDRLPHTEDGLRRFLVKLMGQWWHFQRHEDRLSTGIADLSYAGNGVDGWVELKVSKNGPWLKGLKACQRRWLCRRGKAGNGKVFVFVWVKTKDEDTLAVYRWDELKKCAPKYAPITLDLRGDIDLVHSELVRVMSN